MSDKLSPNGAVIMSGTGISETKKRIEAAFAAARLSDGTNAIDTTDEISIEDPVALDALIKQIPT
jgi:hypothetical protein